MDGSSYNFNGFYDIATTEIFGHFYKNYKIVVKFGQQICVQQLKIHQKWLFAFLEQNDVGESI